MPYGLPELKTPDLVGDYARGSAWKEAKDERARKQPIIEQLEKLNIRKGEQAIAAGERNITLKDMAIASQKEKKESEDMADFGRAAAWSKTPEQWEQSLDLFEGEGKDVSRFRGRFDLAPAVGALNNPDYAKQQLAQQNLMKVIETMPEDDRAQALAFGTAAPGEFYKQLGKKDDGADFTKGKEFITKDKDNNLILNTSVFNKRTGKQEIGQSPITEQLVDTLGDTGDEKSLRIISDSGGKAGAAAKAKLSVKAAQDAFEQVVIIDAGISLLDEGIAELEAGADVGIIDKFLPSIKAASSRFDNVAARMGLQVVSSVTFGALSAGELKVAMDTAVPPNLDNKQLSAWFKKRKEAQSKLRGFYIDIAKQASEEGKTPAEIMIDIENKKKSSKQKGGEKAKVSASDIDNLVSKYAD